MLDPAGHLLTDAAMRTGLPGLYGAGDLRAGSPGQAGSALGDGIAAAAAAFTDVRDA